MKYFTNVRTLDELKAAYRRLAMQYHPDRGGDQETMKAINAEHDALFELLKRQQNERADADETGRTHHTTETAEEFREIIVELLKLDGLDIEICGSWMWIGGNTREQKERLKALGCRWSNHKKLWYWHHPEEGVKWHKRKTTMAEIRSKYGSETISSNRNTRLEAAV